MNDLRFLARTLPLAALASRHAQWHALSEGAIEPNPFYGADFLAAAVTHLHPARGIDALIVEDRADENRLCALFPLEAPHLRDGVLWGARALYRNPFICLTAPLIRAGDAEAILDAALVHLAGAARRLILPLLGEQRAFAALLARVAERRGLPLLRVDGHARPSVETGLDAETYRATRWKKALRAADRRRLRQLAEVGAVEFRTIANTGPEARHALEAFLDIEARGWKGRAGSALRQHTATHAFAQAAFLPASGARTTLFEMLTLDGIPRAVNINLVAGGAGFALKSTYDEDFARLAPGNLLDGHSLALACAGGPLERLDSCAPLTHPTAGRWREAESVSRFLLGLEPGIRVEPMRRWLAALGPFGLWRGFGG